MAEIDAPEKNQPFGAEAKAALSAKILGKTVVVGWGTRGRYGRIIGMVYVEKEEEEPRISRMGADGEKRRYSQDDYVGTISLGLVEYVSGNFEF